MLAPNESGASRSPYAEYRVHQLTIVICTSCDELEELWIYFVFLLHSPPQNCNTNAGATNARYSFKFAQTFPRGISIKSTVILIS